MIPEDIKETFATVTISLRAAKENIQILKIIAQRHSHTHLTLALTITLCYLNTEIKCNSNYI